MKQISVISDVYKNVSVNFNGFVAKFNNEGKGVFGFEENQTESVEKVFKFHPYIYKGDKLPVKEKVETSISKEETSEISNVEFEQLKQSNKALALENVSLKKENETLKKEKEELENKISALQTNEIKTSSDTEKKSEENVSGEENVGGEENKNEEASLKEDLNKKTVTQLKALLNAEDFGFSPFKEEWKNLTKKDDIIDYILKKVAEEK